jgi:hypothetical protein
VWRLFVSLKKISGTLDASSFSDEYENLFLVKSKSSPIKESSPSFLADAFVSDGYPGSVRASINSREQPGAV